MINGLSVTKQTMSSLEIAELTGKRHDNVLADIRRILNEVDIEFTIFSGVYTDQQLIERPCFNLPRRECDLVIAGYSAKYRLAIIDRWQALESKQSLSIPNFSDPAEAAIAWAEQYRLTQSAIATKAEIGSRREATAMNTASQAVIKANKLATELDKSKSHATIKRMEMLHHGVKFNWRLLKSACSDLGVESIDIFDANYGTVKAYPADAWMEAYALSIEG